MNRRGGPGWGFWVLLFALGMGAMLARLIVAVLRGG